MTTKTSTWLRSLLLICLVTAAYLPATQCGFIWDDDAYVTNNETLRSLGGLRQIWFTPDATPQYYPLVHSSFWAEYHLWGLAPAGFHIVNLLLHALGAILLYKVLVRLSVPGAWLAAAIFALHPVQVESVAWVTERKNVLSAVFYLASALAYWRFRPPDETGERRAWRWYALALVLFIAALLSKTVACSLPAALLLVYWWKQGRLRWAEVLPLLPFFLTGACLGLSTAWLETHHVGARGAEWSLSLAQRCLIAGRALWFYAGKLAWPAHLTFVYPRWNINAGIWWQWLFPAAVAGVVGTLWLLRSRLGRGPLVAVLFFAGTLGPALGFVNVYPMRYTFVADHYQYLACIGLIVLCSAALCRIPLWTKGTLLAVLVFLTWQHEGAFRDKTTLWRDTVAKNPTCWLAWNNLGLDDLQKGKTDEAMLCFEKSIALNASDAEAIYNLGNAHLQKGELEPAAASYLRALELNPDLAEAHGNLGNILFQTGHPAEAVQHWQKAVALQPLNPASLNNLAWVLATFPGAELRNGAQAVALAQRANQLTGSNNPRVLRTLAAAYAEAGRMSEAVATAQAARQQAEAEGDHGLANDLEAQIKLHQSGLPMHGPSQMKP